MGKNFCFQKMENTGDKKELSDECKKKHLLIHLRCEIQNGFEPTEPTKHFSLETPIEEIREELWRREMQFERETQEQRTIIARNVLRDLRQALRQDLPKTKKFAK